MRCIAKVMGVTFDFFLLKKSTYTCILYSFQKLNVIMRVNKITWAEIHQNYLLYQRYLQEKVIASSLRTLYLIFFCKTLLYRLKKIIKINSDRATIRCKKFVWWSDVRLCCQNVHLGEKYSQVLVFSKQK